MELSSNQIYQGDCVTLLGRLEPESVDLVFADPPFNIGYQYDVYDDLQHSDEYLAWCHQWMSGVHRALKSNGTFWLAIGDEYAAELKIEAQKLGFHCRSWVIWYYTFGVNCVNGFSRSHTHLFHFVKDQKNFTFNRLNPQIRVKSARQLVYADGRANPKGRLPDNTWITRPQDAPLSFAPMHDTWYYARVAGTFKEREGFHGCQMPEQLLARIIRASSHPQDLVLDPFGGSGTTLCVAKKLGRRWMGFELSPDYAQYIAERLQRTNVADQLDGAEDPIESAPSTRQGKRRKYTFDASTEATVIEAFEAVDIGFSVEYLICNPELNAAFITECVKLGLKGAPYFWNRYLIELCEAGKLPTSNRRPDPIHWEQVEQFSYASEIAWRLLAIDYHKSLDDILCAPEFALEFDRLARLYAPADAEVSSTELRMAALAIRDRWLAGQALATTEFEAVLSSVDRLPELSLARAIEELDIAGVYLLCTSGIPVYAGESAMIRNLLLAIKDCESWQNLKIDRVRYIREDRAEHFRHALKAAIVIRERPMLNYQRSTEETEKVRFNPSNQQTAQLSLPFA
jgi:site-specific DNA-methyltransferase (adenine-specific)